MNIKIHLYNVYNVGLGSGQCVPFKVSQFPVVKVHIYALHAYLAFIQGLVFIM